MTVIDVQPSIYQTAAGALYQSACDLFAEVQANYAGIAGCGSMAGSYDDAIAWAKSYDTSAAQAVDLATRLATTMDKYAKTLRAVGYNHQMADYTATTGSKGPAPDRPAAPLPAVTVCDAPPPSSGGPGNGLSDVVHLAEKVGITIPDGDTGKLAAVGDAWAALQNAHAVRGLSDEIGRIINSVRLVNSPEAETVIGDLKNIREAAVVVAHGFGSLAKACHDHRDALDELRRKLEKQLEDLAKEIIEEIGVGLAISIAASFVTFGLGALIEAARVARIVEKFAGPIKDMVEAWKKQRDLGKAIKAEEKAEKKAEELRRLEQRVGDNSATDWLTGGAKLTDEQRWTLMRGPSRDTIRALRRGDLTPQQQQEVDNINRALDKLPTHQGPVTRQIQLDPDEMAQFQPEESRAVSGFMNSSSRAGNASMTDTTNTTFHIMSKTGRDVSEYGGTPDEVMFKSGTNFLCKSKKFDPATGRTIITLIEQ